VGEDKSGQVDPRRHHVAMWAVDVHALGMVLYTASLCAGCNLSYANLQKGGPDAVNHISALPINTAFLDRLAVVSCNVRKTYSNDWRDIDVKGWQPSGSSLSLRLPRVHTSCVVG
jgi:hypothetical protein